MNRAGQILTAVVSVVAVVAVAAWYHASNGLHDSRIQLVGSMLQPIATLLQEDQAILQELQAESSGAKDPGILQSYLFMLRRDGVVKTAHMRQRLNKLAENNTALITLITAYRPNAKTTAFALEANKFREYALVWRDRWNAVTELFMSGGDYPAAIDGIPNGFAAAVQVEIAAVGDD